MKSATLNLLAQVGVVVSLFDSYDGKVILEGAEAVADALADVAMQNPAVRKAILSLSEGSAYVRLAMAVANIAFPIAVHHGLIPNFFGSSYAKDREATVG